MAVLFLILGPQAVASEIYENWISARALGMGNAFSSVADDYNALFYNPAGLDKIHGLHLTLLTPQIGTDALNVAQIYNDMTGSNYATIIHNYFGQLVWVGFSDALGYSMHDFALAGFDNFNLSFNLHNPAYPNVTMRLTDDYGIAGGFGTSLLPNDALRMGFTVKRVTRYGGSVPFGPSTLATLSNSQLTGLINNYGTGYGLDAGMLLTVPGTSQFTLAAVWQNIGQTNFTLVGGSTPPPPMDDDPTLGFSLLLDAKVVTVRPSFDFAHINLDQSEQLGKLMHLGVELNFIGGLSVRAGLNQGYYTAGVGIDLKYIRIDVASYGVELDTYPGQLEDRRYILQFTMDLNFDPSFDLFGGSANGSGTGGAVSRGFQRR